MRDDFWHRHGSAVISFAVIAVVIVLSIVFYQPEPELDRSTNHRNYDTHIEWTPPPQLPMFVPSG
jgi:hypothetical protein